MPRLTAPIADEYQAITRRISIGLSKHVIELLDMPFDIDILYKGESNQVTTWNAETKLFRKPSEIRDGGRFNTGNQLDIEVKEDINESGYGTNNMKAHSQLPPIWYHPKADIRLQPNYITKTLTITMTYRSKNMELADRLRNQLLTLLSTSRDVLLVDLMYYVIPNPGHIAILKNLKALTGETDEDLAWFKKYSVDGSLTDLRQHKLGGSAEYAFKEVQAMVPFIIDVREIPDKSKRSNSPGYEFSFDVKITYDKPYSTFLQFPIVINNKMVPNEYIITPEVDNRHGLKNAHKTPLMKMNDVLIENYYFGMKGSYTDHHGVVVPLGDDWKPPAFSRPTQIVFQGLVPYSSPDEYGRRIVGNLTKYGKYLYLSPTLKKYLKEHRGHLKFLSDSILNISLFKNNQQIQYSNYHIDEHLNVIMNEEITTWDRLHLVITIPLYLDDYEHRFFVDVGNYPILVEEILNQYVVNSYRRPISEIYSAIQSEQRITPVTYGPKKTSHLVETFFRIYPYERLGLWHDILEAALFAYDTEQYSIKEKRVDLRYRYLIDALLNKSGVKQLASKNLDHRFMLLVKHREWLYDQFIERAKFGKPDIAYRYFYGKIDVLGFKQMAITRRKMDPDTLHEFAITPVFYQMMGYIQIPTGEQGET